MLTLLAWVWERYFGEALRKVEADSLAYRLSDEGRRIDWKTPTILITAALALVVQNYTTDPTDVAGVCQYLARTLDGPEAADAVRAKLQKWEADDLSRHIWWALVSAFTYAVIPMLVLKLAFRARLTDYGLKVRGILTAWPLYVLFTVVMVPLVAFFSGTEHFQRVYPFVRMASAEQVRAELWKWELAYAAQFIGLEFFFRGFLVHGTKHRFGVYAVFVSMLPYVQIHFLKPMPEAVASIIAGIVLGFMSLVTRSVWLGAALHIGVAWGMDFAVLTRRGLL
jgi:uncharacterized protein